MNVSQYILKEDWSGNLVEKYAIIDHKIRKFNVGTNSRVRTTSNGGNSCTEVHWFLCTLDVESGAYYNCVYTHTERFLCDAPDPEGGNEEQCFIPDLTSGVATSMVYKLSPVRQIESNQRIKGSEPYFIYQKNSKTGTLFDSIRQTGTGTKASVDSILLYRAYTREMNSDFTDTSWQKTDSIKDKQSLIEKFAPRTASANPTNIDSVFFYYTAELKDYDYSFSKKADSLASMKLYHLRFLYNAKLTPDNKLFKARELFFKIEKKDISDADSVILDLVNRYENILGVNVLCYLKISQRLIFRSR